MLRNRLVLSVGLVFLILIVAAAAFLGGHQVALRNLTFKNVSATQAAQAMKNDEFYADYKDNTLIIHGTVSSVSQQSGDVIVGLKTNSTYQTLCKLNSAPNIKPGAAITVAAIGGNAVRQSSAVLLQNCVSI